jgi:hypothetical protein
MVYYFGSMDSLEPSFPFNLLGFPGGLMPIGTIITVTGGTHVGCTAEILGVTEKMYQIRLGGSQQVVTKVKHENAQGWGPYPTNLKGNRIIPPSYKSDPEINFCAEGR